MMSEEPSFGEEWLSGNAFEINQGINYAAKQDELNELADIKKWYP